MKLFISQLSAFLKVEPRVQAAWLSKRPPGSFDLPIALQL